jgi:hypothetical protein
MIADHTGVDTVAPSWRQVKQLTLHKPNQLSEQETIQVLDKFMQ